MTAAMLVLEPIFEATLPPEQYAYRPGRNAQQAVVEVEELLFRGRPEVVNTPPTQASPCSAILPEAAAVPCRLRHRVAGGWTDTGTARPRRGPPPLSAGSPG